MKLELDKKELRLLALALQQNIDALWLKHRNYPALTRTAEDYAILRRNNIHDREYLLKKIREALDK